MGNYLLIVLVMMLLVFVALRIRRNALLSEQEAKLEQIINVLSVKNADFTSLHPSRSSHPKVWIFGELKSQAEIDQLTNAVVTAFGESEGHRIVRVRLARNVHNLSE